MACRGGARVTCATRLAWYASSHVMSDCLIYTRWSESGMTGSGSCVGRPLWCFTEGVLTRDATSSGLLFPADRIFRSVSIVQFFDR